MVLQRSVDRTQVEGPRSWYECLVVIEPGCNGLIFSQWTTLNCVQSGSISHTSRSQLGQNPRASPEHIIDLIMKLFYCSDWQRWRHKFHGRKNREERFVRSFCLSNCLISFVLLPTGHRTKVWIVFSLLCWKPFILPSQEFGENHLRSRHYKWWPLILRVWPHRYFLAFGMSDILIYYGALPLYSHSATWNVEYDSVVLIFWMSLVILTCTRVCLGLCFQWRRLGLHESPSESCGSNNSSPIWCSWLARGSRSEYRDRFENTFLSWKHRLLPSESKCLMSLYLTWRCVWFGGTAQLNHQ
jgi:hypothetical protein